jgi:hypothetical protein
MDNCELRLVHLFSKYFVTEDGSVLKLLDAAPRGSLNTKDNYTYSTPHSEYKCINDNWFLVMKPRYACPGDLRLELRLPPQPVQYLVAGSFIENPNDYPYVRHIDGDLTNNEVSNLEWVPYNELTQMTGDVGNNSSFKKLDYGVIKELLETTLMSQQEVADMVGCSRTSVEHFCRTNKVQRLANYTPKRGRRKKA